MVTKPKLSGKEKADDIPSFAQGRPRYVDQTSQEYAEELMSNQYGKDWRKADTGKRLREYSRIKKYGDRNFKSPDSKR